MPQCVSHPVTSPEIILKVVIAGKRPELPPTVPAALKELAAQCWAQEVHRRPTFQQLRQRFQEVLAVMDELVAQSREVGLQLARERGCITDLQRGCQAQSCRAAHWWQRRGAARHSPAGQRTGGSVEALPGTVLQGSALVAA